MKKYRNIILIILALVIYGRRTLKEELGGGISDIDFSNEDEFKEFLSVELKSHKEFVFMHESEDSCGICNSEDKKSHEININGKLIKHTITNDKDDTVTHFFSRE